MQYFANGKTYELSYGTIIQINATFSDFPPISGGTSQNYNTKSLLDITAKPSASVYVPDDNQLMSVGSGVYANLNTLNSDIIGVIVNNLSSDQYDITSSQSSIKYKLNCEQSLVLVSTTSTSPYFANRGDLYMVGYRNPASGLDAYSESKEDFLNMVKILNHHSVSFGVFECQGESIKISKGV
jgi:hypothetical protein